MTTLARLQIEADSRQVRTAGRDLNNFGRTAKTTQGVTQRLGRAFAGLGISIGALAVLRSSVKTMMDFNEAMSAVQAVTGATGDELETLERKARDMGATTQFSATQAAGALEFLGRAGFSSQQAVASLGDVLNLAAASGMELARAADIASNIMSGFNLEAEEAGRMSDVLAAGAASANTNVEQLGGAMSFVAPVAATLGISLEETTAAIGGLSNAGIQGQKAGTGLRRVLIQLIKPTDQAKDALQSYGLSLDDIDPTLRSFTDILQTLTDANIEAKDSAVIFGAEGVSAFEALSSQLPNIRELNNELERADGAALDQASTRTDNLAGDIRNLASAFQELQLSIFDDEVDSSMRSFVQAATGLTRAMSDNIEVIDTMIRFVGILTGIKLAGWAFGAAAAFKMLGARAAFLTGPAGIIAAVITITAEAARQFAEARRETEAFGDAIDTLSAKQMRRELESLERELHRLETAELRDPEFFETENHRKKIALLEDRIGELQGGLNDLDSSASESRSSVDSYIASWTGLGEALVPIPGQLEQIASAQRSMDDIIDEGRELMPNIPDLDLLPPGQRGRAAQGGAEQMQAQQFLERMRDRSQEVALTQDQLLAKVIKTGTEGERLYGKWEGALRDVGSVIEDDISRGLTDIIMQAESATDVFEGLLDTIARTIIQQQVADPFAQAITAGIGGMFGGAPGSTSVGGGAPPNVRGIGPARANGGNVSNRNAHLVGERGPEMFVPGQDGRIVPNDQMNGGDVTVNVINQGGDRLEAEQQQTRRGPNGDMTVDVMVKKSMERLDSQGQLDGIFRRHGSRRQGQF